eukprot:UN22575
MTAEFLAMQHCHIEMRQLDVGRDVFEVLAECETNPYLPAEEQARRLVTPDHPVQEIVKKIYASKYDIETKLITLMVDECDASLAKLKRAGARARGFLRLGTSEKISC